MNARDIIKKLSGSEINTSIALPIGSMTMFAGTVAPTGWLLCDGTAISRTTYSGLFTAIGVTWGIGDNSTTFNLPDMREASPYGVGTRASGIEEHDALTLGQFGDDRGQGHRHRPSTDSSVGGLVGGVTYNTTSQQTQNLITTDPITDGTNGTPRTGKTTRGKIIGVNYIIKV